MHFDKLPISADPTRSAENDYSARESWRMLGIMAEFVEATERLASIRPAVSIFGSARTPADHA
ncbi:MAG: TIGR00730 family Rossman fold protein, partial [Thiobacillus sp.]|nr:TIGR00730 family Rossman fold protein [Thiobacillus sp.]